MPPRKQSAASAEGVAATRARRSVQPKKGYTEPQSDDSDGPGSASGSEGEQEQQPQQRGRRGAATRTAGPKPGPSSGAASGPGRKGRTPAKEPASRARSASRGKAQQVDTDDEEDSSEDEEQEEQQVTARGNRSRSRAAGGTAAAAALQPDKTPSRTARTRRGPTAQQEPPAAVPAARKGTGKDVEVAGGQRESDGEEEDEEEESDEEGDEDGEEVDVGRAGAAAVKCLRSKGRGRNAPAAPTVDSRKRLLELLERRVGGGAAGGQQHGEGAGGSEGGGRIQYGDLPLKNPNKKTKLLLDLRNQFDDWHSRLRSGSSLLLYGFGSKRTLLEDFARLLAGPRNRGDAAVLVFHGYNPRCTAKEVVLAVAGALLQRSYANVGATGAAGGGAGGAGGGGGSSSSSGAAVLRRIVDDIRAEPLERHAFVVLHNLDGPGLRGDIPLLSALASCPQVHLVASVDHAMAPLLWEPADAARFRWQYINATTFQPYLAETQGAPSVLLGAFKSGVVTAGAGTVLRSLVLGAQAVFRTLAEHLLAEDDTCEGVAFAHLYRMCRERFLVRDERVLRQHLVEFVDHKLVVAKVASDSGGELLTIPLAREDLQAVVDEMEAAGRQGE